MALPMVTLSATFTLVSWEDAWNDEHPVLNHGYCDPQNPWGTIPSVIDRENEHPESAQEPRTITLPLYRAAQLVERFPGGVWDHRESELSTICYRTGLSADVTLHVHEGDGWLTVLELAEALER